MIKDKIMNTLDRILMFCCVYLIIGFLWVAIDIAQFGEAQPSLSDTFFGFVLADLICKIYFDKSRRQ